MEELKEKIKLIDQKMLLVSRKLDKAKNKAQEFDDKRQNVSSYFEFLEIDDKYKNVMKNIDELDNMLDELEYARIRLTCSLSEKLFDKDLGLNIDECIHDFDIISVKKQDDYLWILSKCFICGYNETIYIKGTFKSYEELIKHLNSNNEHYKYIGGCSCVDEIENEFMKENSSGRVIKKDKDFR